ncbi:MAG: nucleotide exchange factor GrpE [candidate division KSB1 bacterium]|nr:nucleotide exchange factor GrpE [candidate division KSB1 bacterium]
MIDKNEEYKIEVSHEDEGPDVNGNADEHEKSDDDGRLLNRLQRLQAEFENYKKREEREKGQLSSYVKGQLVSTILPIIDDMERLLKHEESDENNVMEGVRAIYMKLLSILEKEGLEPIESLGKNFDPNLHEAVSIERGNEDMHNVILDEWEKGYTFKSKLLRPAKVIVCQVQE